MSEQFWQLRKVKGKGLTVTDADGNMLPGQVHLDIIEDVEEFFGERATVQLTMQVTTKNIMVEIEAP